MKAGRVAAAAAIAATGVNAQGAYGSSSVPVSYTTVTYDVCPTSVVQSMVTVTNGVTVTYCPECEMGGMSTGSASPADTTHTTVYTTTYMSLCPTSGTVPATYTITESCTGATPTFNTESTHIPPDFTVTTDTCHVCGPTPVPVTITQPCGCKATEGTPAPQPNPQPTGPAGSASPDQSMGPGSGGAPPATSGSAQTMAPGQPIRPGSGGAAPAPSGPGCPGPQCQAAGSTGTAAPAPGSAGVPPVGSKPSPTPSQSASCPGGTNCPASPQATYAGAASPSHAIGLVSSVLVAIVAAFAFGL